MIKKGRVAENVVHFLDLGKRLEESLDMRRWKRIFF
jgi:hypothetical protein